MIYIDTIITIAAVITAITVVLTTTSKAHKWFIKQSTQDEDIRAMKTEQQIICYGLLAALDGLKQLGADGNVDGAYTRLEKHINENAHK